MTTTTNERTAALLAGQQAARQFLARLASRAAEGMDSTAGPLLACEFAGNSATLHTAWALEVAAQGGLWLLEVDEETALLLTGDALAVRALREGGPTAPVGCYAPAIAFYASSVSPISC